MSWVCRGRIDRRLSLLSPSSGLKNGTPGEAPRDAAPVLSRAMKIIQEIDPTIDQVGRRRDHTIVQPLTPQCRLRGLSTPSDRCGSRNPNANIGDRALPVEDDHGADTDDGVPRGLVRQLLVAPAMPLCRNRDEDLGEDFIRLQRGGQEIEKKFPRRNPPLTLAAPGDNRCVESEDRRRIVSSRIGMCEGASDCSSVTHLAVTDASRGVREQRNRGSNLPIGRALMMGR
jgi:hypothetical protein